MDKNSEYGKIFSEISKGYSLEEIEKQKYYFKHPSLSEYFSVYSNYEHLIKKAKKLGLETEKEKLEEAIKNNWWSKEKESTVESLTKTIQNLIITKSKLAYPSQKKEIDLQIKKIESILITYQKERQEIIGYTVESFSNQSFGDEMIFLLSYKDSSLLDKAFKTEDDYYSLSEIESNQIKNIYIKYNNIFSSNIIKRIAATGFFQNLVYLNDDPYKFWGKPTIYCSKYQIDLLLYGKMFRKTIESYAKNDQAISEDIISDPEKFVVWFESQQGKPISKSKLKPIDSKNSVSSFVGANKEDLNQMGVEVEKIKGKSLIQMAIEKGGEIEKKDYLHVRENI